MRPLSLALALGLAPLVGGLHDAQRRSAASGPWSSPDLGTFEVSVAKGLAPLAVRFYQLAPYAEASVLWDFGDGNTSTRRSPTHVYDAPGTYTATLTLTTLWGELTSSQTIQADAVLPGFVNDLVFRTKSQTAGVFVKSHTDFLTWTKGGEVWRWHDGAFNATPTADLSEEVGNWGDHGLLRVLMHPDFDSNGYLYFLYVVDRYYLDNFGTPGYVPSQSRPQTETIARLTRYTVFDPSDPDTTIDPSTRFDLIGATIAEGIPVCGSSHGIGDVEFGADGSIVLSTGDSWLGSTLEAACANLGWLTPRTTIEAFRAQLVDSPFGKILRMDPVTGEGLPDNPFYDPLDPSAWRSRVWALGLRNPYSFVLRDETGESAGGSGPGVLYIADVGPSSWEEISVVDAPGANLGHPLWSGLAQNTFWYDKDRQNLDAPNPLFGMSGCVEPFFRFEDLIVEDTQNAPSWPNPCDPGQQIPSTIPRFVHHRPAIAWLHGDQPGSPATVVPGFSPSGEAIALSIDSPSSPVQGKPFPGNAAIAGVWLARGAFPAPFDDVMFNADFGEQWIKAFVFGPNLEHEGETLVAVHDFAQASGRVNFLTTDPDEEALYYLAYDGSRGLYRIRYASNAVPIAQAQGTPGFGPAPLRAQLSALASTDPEGQELEYAWDLGDGEPWSPLHTWPDPVHVYPSEDVTALGRVIASAGEGPTGVASPAASEEPPHARAGRRLDGSRTTARVAGGSTGSLYGAVNDGIYGELGQPDPSRQSVVRGHTPWVGYRLPERRRLVALIYQEGRNAGGASLSQPVVESLDPVTQAWVPVSNLRLARPLPGDPSVAYETFHLSFDTVRTRAIRLRDARPLLAGEEGRFTVGELRLFALPEPVPGMPGGRTATVTVADPGGLSAQASTLVSFNNTPPAVTMTSPVQGQTYPVGIATVLPMTAIVTDAEHGPSELTCEWQATLVHDNHFHPEAPVFECQTSMLLQPHGELEGDVIYWVFTLTVTDAEGLATSVSTSLLPEGDCNLNGIEDSLDITSGYSLDLNRNGIPDECE